MNSLYANNKNIIKRTDSKNSEKGQKILAAIYLVTNHLSDTDPLRLSLRLQATSLVTTAAGSVKDSARTIEILLGGAVFAGLISEKNSSVIIYEVDRFAREHVGDSGVSDMEDFFGPRDMSLIATESPIKDMKRTSSPNLVRSAHRSMSAIGTDTKIPGNKTARQDTILSFINDRKSAVIKDITSLFPDVSEKTIQRELGVLVESGKITKRGSKRWSVYMAVNSLL